MSEAAKKPRTSPIEFRVDGKVYRVPKTKAREALRVLKPYEVEDDEKTISWRDAFAEDIEEYGEPSLMLQAYMTKKEMKQHQLAEATGIRKSHISEMYNGRRPIGKETAKKLAKVLGCDYRRFL